MNRDEKQTFYKINWDNEFSVRFNLEKDMLKHIPNNIFSVELPEIDFFDMNDDNLSKTLKLTLRSTVDGSVEQEIFDILCRQQFNIDISLSNPNIVSWKYSNCSIEKIAFTPLVDRKSRANPFNFILYINVSQVTYNAGSMVVTFGDDKRDTYTAEKNDAQGIGE
jgi:hypothetical protein